jgi:hypothetical protein
MNKQYRICLIVPNGYKHSEAFFELAILLKHSIIDCGYSCDIAVNNFLPDATNILLGYHLTRFNPVMKSISYIPYQLEQLSATEGVYNPSIQEILQHATDIWDYSPENIAFLASKDIKSRHLPIGYHPKLKQIVHAQNKEIDLLFYGSVGERRKTVLDQIAMNQQLKVKALFGVYGEARDQWIGHSRMVINIHHYSAQIFEAVRISYLLNNKVCVLSEHSQNYPYDKVDIPRVAYKDLAETVRSMLSQPGKTREIGENTAEQFERHYQMAEMIAPLLK